VALRLADIIACRLAFPVISCDGGLASAGHVTGKRTRPMLLMRGVTGAIVAGAMSSPMMRIADASRMLQHSAQSSLCATCAIAFRCTCRSPTPDQLLAVWRSWSITRLPLPEAYRPVHYDPRRVSELASSVGNTAVLRPSALAVAWATTRRLLCGAHATPANSSVFTLIRLWDGMADSPR
jgi:hypothetical protein